MELPRADFASVTMVSASELETNIPWNRLANFTDVPAEHFPKYIKSRLTLCLLGNFCMRFFVCCSFVGAFLLSKSTFLKNYFRDIIQVSKTVWIQIRPDKELFILVFVVTSIHGSRKFCQRGSNFDNSFSLFFVFSFWGKRGSKYHYQQTGGPSRPAGGLLACWWWPNIECWPGSFVIFRGPWPVLLRIFRGSRLPAPLWIRENLLESPMTSISLGKLSKNQVVSELYNFLLGNYLILA